MKHLVAAAVCLQLATYGLLLSSCGGGDLVPVVDELPPQETESVVQEESSPGPEPAAEEEQPAVEDANLVVAEIVPEVAPLMLDTDVDGIEDNADNCPFSSNPDQKNTDKQYYNDGVKTPAGDYATADDYGNACDDDIDGDGLNVVYVNIAGSDSAPGTFYEPVKSVGKALEIVALQGGDIYVSAGVYSLDSAEFTTGVNIYGGYKAGYSERQVKTENEFFKTVLTSQTSPVTLNIDGFDGTLILDGFFIKNSGSDDGVNGLLPDTDDFGCSQATVFIKGADVDVTNSIINVSDEAIRPCGLLVGEGAIVNLGASEVDATGWDGAVSSAAVAIVGGQVSVTDSKIIGGSGEHVTGIRLINADAYISNNIIDGTTAAASPKTAYAVAFDGGSPKLIGNTIFTNDAPDQAVLVCLGDDPHDAEIKNNLLTTFPQSGTNAILMDCEGKFILTSDFLGQPDFGLVGAAVEGNVPFSGTISELLGGK